MPTRGIDSLRRPPLVPGGPADDWIEQGSVRPSMASMGGSMYRRQAMRIGNWKDGSDDVKPLLRSVSWPVGAALASAGIRMASAMDAARPLAFMAHPSLRQLPAHSCSGALSWSIQCLPGSKNARMSKSHRAAEYGGNRADRAASLSHASFEPRISVSQRQGAGEVQHGQRGPKPVIAEPRHKHDQ